MNFFYLLSLPMNLCPAHLFTCLLLNKGFWKGPCGPEVLQPYWSLLPTISLEMATRKNKNNSFVVFFIMFYLLLMTRLKLWDDYIISDHLK